MSTSTLLSSTTIQQGLQETNTLLFTIGIVLATLSIVLISTSLIKIYHGF